MVNVPKHDFTIVHVHKTWYNHGKCPQKCDFTIVHVHKTWFYHGKCPQNVVLPLYMSIKHGIIMVNVPKMCFYHCSCP